MRKFATIVICSVLCFFILVPSTFAKGKPVKDVDPTLPKSGQAELLEPGEAELLDLTLNEKNGAESQVIITEYDEDGNVKKTKVIENGTITTSTNDNNIEVSQTELALKSVTTSTSPTLDTGIGTYVIADPGSMGYVLIDTFNSDSRYIDTLNEWVYQFGAAIIPAMISKNVWAGAAGSATWNTFLKPATTKYYRTWVYQAKDTWNYYGYEITRQYSDSSRTKLEKVMEYKHTIPRP